MGAISGMLGDYAKTTPIETFIARCNRPWAFRGPVMFGGMRAPVGQEIGTIWGHGAYLAPDWSADYLHRQSVIVLDRWPRAEGYANYVDMSPGCCSSALLENLMANGWKQSPYRFGPTPSRCKKCMGRGRTTPCSY